MVIYTGKGRFGITVHVWYRGYSGLRGLFIQEKVDLGPQFMFGIDGAVKRESTVMGFTKLVFMK